MSNGDVCTEYIGMNTTAHPSRALEFEGDVDSLGVDQGVREEMGGLREWGPKKGCYHVCGAIREMLREVFTKSVFFAGSGRRHYPVGKWSKPFLAFSTLVFKHHF